MDFLEYYSYGYKNLIIFFHLTYLLCDKNLKFIGRKG